MFGALMRPWPWPEDPLHCVFLGAEVTKSAVDQSFQGKLAGSGKAIAMSKDKTVGEALAAQGIEVRASCEQGVCGTCADARASRSAGPQRRLPDAKRAGGQRPVLPVLLSSKTAMLVLDL